jgi:putative DNA primase/helicase
MIDLDRLPAEIRTTDRAVLWNREDRAGKPTKIPYCPRHPAQRAAVDRPESWAPMAEALAAYADGKADGVGIVLGNGLVGIDLDGCRNPVTGELTPEAQRILAEIDSYTEASVSQTGIHILAAGTLPPGGRRKGQIELYSELRYFTLSGQHVPGTPRTIEHRTTELAALHARVFQATTNGHSRRPSSPRVEGVDLDDAALLAHAQRATNGSVFSSLWSGDTRRYDGDDSAADLALCNLLAFWCQCDASRMDRLFRQSGLYRAKWDGRRGTETYGSITIDRAIRDCRDVYTPKRPTTLHQDARSQPDPTSGIPSDHPLTEAGAAERFAELHGTDVRFDHRRQRWLMWAGHRWMPDADAAVTRLALDFSRRWQREAIELPDRDKREATVKFAIKLERRDAMNNMLALTKALKPIADAGDQWDVDPYLLGVRNGVVDLRTSTLRPGRPEDGITLQTAVPYDPTATCPRWERFVSEIFDGHPDLIGFIQRSIGYSLTGCTSEQVLFLLHGRGANGKGTLTNMLKRVLSDYAWNMPFATIEMRDRSAIPNDLAALVNRRFVIASETNDGSRLNEARVKALTGCDPITARFLHGEFFTFEPVGKFWLSVNHKPIVRDDSFGFWRRLRLIPFSQQFPVNQTLTDDLQAEAPGILTWCVRGALAWQQDGLQAPAIVTDATKQYEEDSDPLAGFLADACDLEPTAVVGAKELFEHYKHWADHHGLEPRERLTATMFGRKMAERLRRSKTRAGWVYHGVARGPA